MNELYQDDYASTLAPIDYQFARQYPSLKGLLKPFKGKGEYEALLADVESCVSRLEKIALKLIEDTRDKLPLKYLPFNLTKRKLNNGSVYLTWRQCKTVIEGKRKRILSIEGKQLVLQAVSSQSTLSDADKQFLIEMEHNRLTINMQMRTCAQLRYLLQDMLPKFDELNCNVML